jgi:hypothetical protein
VLFADGSVRTLSDKNRDGHINNGFSAVGGFADSVVEADEEEWYSLYALDARKR